MTKIDYELNEVGFKNTRCCWSCRSKQIWFSFDLDSTYCHNTKIFIPQHSTKLSHTAAYLSLSRGFLK